MQPKSALWVRLLQVAAMLAGLTPAGCHRGQPRPAQPRGYAAAPAASATADHGSSSIRPALHGLGDPGGEKRGRPTEGTTTMNVYLRALAPTVLLTPNEEKDLARSLQRLLALRRTLDALEGRLGQRPTFAELAERLGLSSECDLKMIQGEGAAARERWAP